MSDEKPEPNEKRPRAIKRKFYHMSQGGGATAMALENACVLAPDTGVLDPFPGRGFPNYSEPPRFVFSRKRGWRAPRDLELFHHYWLVSDRTKAVFESVDAEGFAFVACDVRLAKGRYDGPNYWLCDAIRVLDALDETRSRLTISIVEDPMYRDFGEKRYSFFVEGGAKLVFREDVIGSAHAFRMAHKSATVIADETLKDACKAAGLAGIAFTSASKLF
jgi:hypothetical protein